MQWGSLSRYLADFLAYSGNILKMHRLCAISIPNSESATKDYLKTSSNIGWKKVEKFSCIIYWFNFRGYFTKKEKEIKISEKNQVHIPIRHTKIS